MTDVLGPPVAAIHHGPDAHGPDAHGLHPDDTDSHRTDEDIPPPYPAGHQVAPGYEVVEHIRRGGDLDSYEAWSHERYSRCFVKTPHPDLVDDPYARRSLGREARLLLKLSHPHVVRAYDYVRFDAARPEQPPVLVLENLTGATVGYLLATETRLRAADIGHLGRHLCSALQYLHGRGYLHLDVKPSNIIASHGVARLIDLSLARPPGRCHRGIGTPGYMSPEQIAGGDLGPPADVWGVGLVLYEAATGIQPFDIPGRPTSANSNTSTLSRCEMQLARPAPKVRARRRLSTDVADIIDACLNRDPDQRPTLERLAAALATLTAVPAAPLGDGATRNGKSSTAPETATNPPSR